MATLPIEFRSSEEKTTIDKPCFIEAMAILIDYIASRLNAIDEQMLLKNRVISIFGMRYYIRYLIFDRALMACKAWLHVRVYIYVMLLTGEAIIHLQSRM